MITLATECVRYLGLPRRYRAIQVALTAALAIAVAVLVAGCVAPTAGRSQAGSLQPGSITTVDYLPGGDPSQNIGTLYLPKTASARTQVPVIVLIHGGGWKARVGKDVLDANARDLQDRGNAVWNIEYRRVGRGGGWPTTFSDTAYAVDHLVELKRRAPMLNLDDVVVVGHSAGGQLAVWTASRGLHSESGPGPAPRVIPKAVVSLAGVLNMASDRTRITRNSGDALGGPPNRFAQRYALVNPIERINPDVPVFVVHSRDDAVVRYPVATEYRDRAVAVRAPVTLVTVDHVGHGGLVSMQRGWSSALSAIRAAQSVAHSGTTMTVTAAAVRGSSKVLGGARDGH
ncbi:alpha/beta hydrolase family protein [Gordonia oryzae]|uniref:alpha/beta hydrolase family protein n=1 Tax=Gordonia oryzae TaxID=2487349 RepID=UPI0016147E0E|nr:alpha/beta hydrolase [Gordonia oryzae]